MARPTFSLRVRAEHGDARRAIRSLRAWLKRGLRDYGLVCTQAYQQGGSEMAISYADAEDKRSLLPPGPYQLKAEVLLGSHGADNTLMLAANRRTMHVALMCTVMNVGKYHGRKVYDNITVALDESVQPPLDAAKLENLRTAVRMGRSKIKKIINLARGLDPDDKTEATQAKRAVETHEDLTGMIFWAEIGERAGSGGYDPSNCIDRIIQPGDADYPPTQAHAVVPAKSAAGNSGTASKPPLPVSKTAAQGGSASLRGALDDDIPFLHEWK
jgi:hypothetical protein